MYDYSKLNGRIVEVLGTNKTKAKFALKMGLSSKSVSLKLNNKRRFTQDEIFKAMEVLSIPREQLSEYFFKVKV